MAMRDDPVENRYLPPNFRGFDMEADDWAHQPVAKRGGAGDTYSKNQFKVCIDGGVESWDAAFSVAGGLIFTSSPSPLH